MCKWFFKDATKIQNGRQKSNPNFFVCAKTLKLNVRNYLNFTITFSTIWRCAGDFFRFHWNSKLPPRINFNLFRSRKHKSLKLFKFYNHIPHDMEMYMCFFQGFTEIQNGRHVWTKTQKFKMATTSRLFKYLWQQKTLTQVMAGDDIGLQSSCFLSISEH